MTLERLHLRNFRNFKEFSFQFPERKILKIQGENGTGKTNLLESIYILFTTRSFRNRKTLKDCVRLGENFFHLQAAIDGHNHGITFLQDSSEKSYFINQSQVKGPEYFLGKNILYFSPEETTAFFQSQEIRRSLIDRYLSSLQRDFFDHLLKFAILKNRKVQIMNSSTQKKVHLLKLDSEPFLALSRNISATREKFIEQLNPVFNSYVEQINPKLANTSLRYKKRNIPEDYLEREFQQQRVLYGCHKDELEITENGREVRHFFSNGEKKVINIAIHFAYMDLLNEIQGTGCLACLDDIESELDQKILGNILNIIEGSWAQYIITSKVINIDPSDGLILK